MKADSHKGIVNIKYNHLNLPVTVDFSGRKNNIKEITYIYDATKGKTAPDTAIELKPSFGQKQGDML